MADQPTTNAGEKSKPFKPSGALLIILVLIVAVVIMLTRDGEEDGRHPSPTPTNENVHEIAP